MPPSHAGTARNEAGEIVTAGGRVLNVTGLGPGPAEAREPAYAAAEAIEFDGKQMRTDIAARAVGARRDRERNSVEMQSDPNTETEVAVPKELEPMPEVEAAFEEIEVDAPRVGIIMGSKNDKEKMQPAGAALQEAGIRYEVRVMSAHRDPEKVREYCHAARMRGLRVLIAGAGMSAALPGVAAAHTDLPVIGVPILGKSLGGLDALLSAVQMPPGVPVACVAIDGAKNAGLLAARIILGVIARYTREEIGAVWTRRAPDARLARGRARRHRRLGGARARCPPRTPRPAASAPRSRSRRSRSASARPTTTSPPSSTSSPPRSATRALDPLRAHLLRRPRHGARACSSSRPG